MRWVFFGLLILNVTYLGMSLAGRVLPGDGMATDEFVGAAELQLLSDANSSGIAQDSAFARLPLCLVLGPWTKEQDALAAYRTLSRGIPGIDVRALKIARDRLNWVYIPPRASRSDALRILRDLQTQGVDSFMVNEGADANAISLGYFTNADSARGLQVKMETAGYAAEIRQTVREITEYWLYFPRDSSPSQSDVLSGFLQKDESLVLEQAACATGMPVQSTLN